MDRRAFVGGAAAMLVSGGAQAQRRAPRIGYLTSGARTSEFQAAFVQGLRDLDWVDGRNIVIEYRFADGRFDRLPALAAELVRLGVELIVAQPTPATVAAKNATSTIPVVMINVGEPVRLGLVASLARPGGNVTGTAFDVGLETFGKGLELLKSAVPGVKRVAVLSNSANPSQPYGVREVNAAATALGLQTLVLDVQRSDEFPPAFERMVRERADAVFLVAEGLFILHREALAGLALAHRLPSMCGVRENVDAGALMSYGPSLTQNARRAAVYVDKILKGARPADLPVEQPTTFELVVNLRTAKALGVTIPASILQRADHVVQ